MGRPPAPTRTRSPADSPDNSPVHLQIDSVSQRQARPVGRPPAPTRTRSPADSPDNSPVHLQIDSVSQRQAPLVGGSSVQSPVDMPVCSAAAQSNEVKIMNISYKFIYI